MWLFIDLGRFVSCNKTYVTSSSGKFGGTQKLENTDLRVEHSNFCFRLQKTALFFFSTNVIERLERKNTNTNDAGAYERKQSSSCFVSTCGVFMELYILLIPSSVQTHPDSPADFVHTGPGSSCLSHGLCCRFRLSSGLSSVLLRRTFWRTENVNYILSVQHRHRRVFWII